MELIDNFDSLKILSFVVIIDEESNHVMGHVREIHRSRGDTCED